MSGPFCFLEDSQHAYYLAFDFEEEVTDKSGSTTARADLKTWLRSVCRRAMPLDRGRSRQLTTNEPSLSSIL